VANDATKRMALALNKFIVGEKEEEVVMGDGDWCGGWRMGLIFCCFICR
jgi:hypothetical protein